MVETENASSNVLPALAKNSNYSDEFPSKSNALRLFHGEWVSAIPVAGVATGNANLFQDARIAWLLTKLGTLDGMNVLELGPFEAGHTTMLHAAGPRSILAIEANMIAYMECLVVKEVFDLDRSHFLLGNFEKFLLESVQVFDLIVASGVLYHLIDPLATILQMCKSSRKIFLWSHFFDDVAMPVDDPRREAFTGEVINRELFGHKMKYHVRSYGSAEQPRVFCGGIHAGSVWVEFDEVRSVLEHHGFSVESEFNHPGHQNGPCSCLFATR